MPRLDKVLFLSDFLDVDSSTLRTFDLARALAARGIEVTTIASGGTMVEQFKKAGLRLQYYHRIHRKMLPFVFNGRIIALARSLAPTIIHARSPRLARLAARLARACRVQYAVTVNSIAESRHKAKRSRRCAGVIAASQYLREWLVNNKSVPKEVITVISNGVEVDPFNGARPEARARGNEPSARNGNPPPGPQGEQRTIRAPVVGMIAQRFGAGDGHDCFLEAAVRIAAEIPATQFVIAADGEDRRVRDRLKDAGLTKQTTIVPAFVDFRHLLTSIDVLLVPSDSEGRSRLILDAMACRRPVVAAGVGENYEVIEDGENGLLVQKTNAEAFAARTVELITNSEFRESILDAASETVRKKFSLARMAKDVIAFYMKILG
ncbi:MAG: glycosyltransferase family 4 protein [Planctomycetes bacterium]|nr:glycosyltransferase family 4 protein [Planctomycetota bacterium]